MSIRGAVSVLRATDDVLARLESDFKTRTLDDWDADTIALIRGNLREALRQLDAPPEPNAGPRGEGGDETRPTS
jgi:hypothetical protein